MNNSWIRWITIPFFIFLQFSLTGQGGAYIQESFNQKPLADVFRLLERKYGIKFAYDEEAVVAIKISRRIRATSLEDALDQLFEGTGFVYQVPAPNQVLLRKEEVSPVLSSAKKQEIRGQIVDGWSGVPLPYATVLLGVDAGVAADEQGNFSIQLPPGRTEASVQVQYIGYQPRRITLEGASATHVQIIRLTPKMEQLPGVMVKERAPVISRQAAQDGTSVRIPALARMSFFVGGKDLFRGLQMLPGVDASNDLSADLSIRSSNGDENLVLLDGMTLYNVTHFFGIFSIVNPNIVDQVKIYKNAFPAEYGGRTAAVIDMRTQPMQQEGWNGILDFNLLTSNGVVEAPLGKNMSLLLGFRTANQDLGNSDLFNKVSSTEEVVASFIRGRTSTARTVTTQQPNFYFNDANLKWTWQPSSKTGFLFSYFRGRDRFSYDFSRTIYPPSRRNNNFLKESYSEHARWQNEGFGLHWNQNWGSKLQSQAILAQSGYQNETEIGSSFSRTADSVLAPALNFYNNHFNRIRETNLHLKNTWRTSKDQAVHFGYQGAFSSVGFQIEEDARIQLSGNKAAPQHAWYGQYQTGKLLKQVSLDAGLRYTQYGDRGYLSPRLYAQVMVGMRSYFKGSYGLYQQFVRQLYHEDRSGRSFQYWVLSDERFPVAVSGNSMFGFSSQNKWFDLDIEVYHKATDGVMEHALRRTGLYVVDGKPAAPTYTLFKGSGKTTGIDVLLQKSTPRYAWWAAYTLSKSTHIFPQVLKGEPFPAPNDRRHQLKLNGQYSLGKFDVGASYIFASGRPYTDLSLLEVQEGDRVELRPEERIGYLDDYHRLDLYGNYTFPIWGVEGKVGINLYNVTNHNNVKYRQFIYSFASPGEPGNPANKNPVNTVVGAELEMLGFTPNISFQVKF